jgi:tetratricopeptide (TPR) repeat protein
MHSNVCPEICRGWIRGSVLPLVAVLALLATVGCSDERRAASHRKNGAAFFAAGDYDTARSEYLNLLRIQGDDLEAIERMGMLLADGGALLLAAPYLVKAAERDPTNALVRARLGRFYLAVGELDKAREEARAAVRADPACEDAVLLLVEMPGEVTTLAETKALLSEAGAHTTNTALFRVAEAVMAFREQQLGAAQAAVQSALDANPNLPAALFLQGNLFEMQTNLAAAEVSFQRAAELSPIRSDRRVRFADFKFRQGATNEAKALLVAQSKAAPDYLPALYAQALMALSERNTEEALRFCTTLLERYPLHLDATLLRARIRMQQNEAAKGIAELERIERVYGKVAPYRLQLAVLQAANNEPNKAMATLELILQSNPRHEEAVLLLARLNLQQDRVTQAVQRLESFLEVQPASTAARLLLADALVMRREYDRALAIYRDYARQAPGDPRGPFLVGLVLRQQQQLDAARQEFERTLDLQPEFLAAAAQLVELDMAAQQLDAAASRAQSLVERVPDSAGACLLLARVELARTNWNAAEITLKRAIDLDARAVSAYYLLAKIYRDGDRLQSALEQIDRLLSQSPGDLRALMLKATIHTEKNEPEQTRQAYEALLRVNPPFGPALNNLAFLHIDQLPDLDKAWNYARRAREIEAYSPQTADTLGWVHFKRGEYADALRLLSEAGEKLPAEPEVQYHLGMAHYMMAQETAARSAFERALATTADFRGRAEAERRLDLLTLDPLTGGGEARAGLEAQLKREPNDVLALTRLATVQVAAGDTREAQVTLEAVLKANPHLASAAITLAELKAQAGQKEEALRLVRRAREDAPSDPDVAWRGGRVAMQCHDHVLALLLFQEAARQSGDEPGILADLAEATYVAGRFDEAAVLCRRVAKSNTDEPTRERAAQLEWLVGIYRDPASISAVDETRLTAILTQSPDSVPAKMAMAGVLVMKGNLEAAAPMYRAVLEAAGGLPQTYRELALLHSQPGPLSDPERAYDYAIKARQSLSGDALLTKTLGMLAYQRGDLRYAEQLLREAQRALAQDEEIRTTLRKIKEGSEAASRRLN